MPCPPRLGLLFQGVGVATGLLAKDARDATYEQPVPALVASRDVTRWWPDAAPARGKLRQRRASSRGCHGTRGDAGASQP